ncbi:MAG TPA: helix-hairpin-helix domain-containing protein [Rhizomicrobium sp.]|jgi:hypothetical protein|nr:helix-hairpin-helix domain-containing protein [Rhizomicrobium sp.]
MLGPAIAFGQDDTPAALNQRAASLDPVDYQVVQPVCTRCHTAANFLHSRSWPEWQDVFSRMHANGATASDAQWGQIYRYFLKSLTTLNVNRAGEDELSDVLGVDEKIAIAIVRRRANRKFDGAEDLESVPGVSKEAVEAMEPRLLFDPLPQGR